VKLSQPPVVPAHSRTTPCHLSAAQEFLAARKRLDPKNILGNQLMDALFGAPQA